MLERILEVIIIHTLLLYPEAYTGDVIYPLNGTAELELRTSDCQSSLIQWPRSNPKNKTPLNLLKDVKALEKKHHSILSFCTTSRFYALSFSL